MWRAMFLGIDELTRDLMYLIFQFFLSCIFARQLLRVEEDPRLSILSELHPARVPPA